MSSFFRQKASIVRSKNELYVKLLPAIKINGIHYCSADLSTLFAAQHERRKTEITLIYHFYIIIFAMCEF